jgi:uncharacterized phage protein gp47/JayE
MAERRIYTFNEIVSTVTTKIGSLSQNLTDFSSGSNIGATINAISHFIEFLQKQTNVAQEAFVIRGAKDLDLDNRVQDFGLNRNQAVFARDILRFTSSTPAAATFVIPAGAVVSTQPDVVGNTIDYSLDSDLTFASGSTSATGYITCTTAGLVGNVPSGFITNITSPISGVTSISNPIAFTNGAEKETDEALRKRVPVFLNGLKSASLSSIKSAALSIEGITFANVESGEPTLGQVTVYVSNQSGTLSAQQLSSVKDAVQEAAAFGVVANVVTPTVTFVTISVNVTYDAEYYDANVFSTALKSKLYDFVQINPDTTLKLRDLRNIIHNIPGVTDYNSLKIDGVEANKSVGGFNVIRLADESSSITVNLTEA